jgi:translation initiation factor IF-1
VSNKKYLKSFLYRYSIRMMERYNRTPRKFTEKEIEIMKGIFYRFPTEEEKEYNAYLSKRMRQDQMQLEILFWGIVTVPLMGLAACLAYLER